MSNKITKEVESEKLSLEDTFENINLIMAKLSDDSISLEESFGLYKEGMEMLKSCKDIIDDVEKRVIMLSGDKEEVYDETDESEE